MPILQGFQHLPAALDRPSQEAIIRDLRRIIAEAPLYVPAMPRTGKPLSVRMTNCGTLGWLTDKDGGYHYQTTHPLTGRPWPAMPQRLLDIWKAYAGDAAPPEACLINYYGAGTKLGSHRDEDEEDKSAPVASISLGDDAVFHVGGLKRTDAKTRMTLRSGDIVILGGDARLAFHGIDKVVPGTSDLLPEGGRFNLTLRRVTVPTF